jgi:peroxiredoxin
MEPLDRAVADSLKAQLDALREQQRQSSPELIASTLSDIAAISRTTIIERRLQPGDSAPDFSLPASNGGSLALADLLQRGPVVITFYRGAWCGYCDLQLRFYERLLPQIEALGATLVAISPQTVARSARTAAEHNLSMLLLSDRGNQVARSYQLVYSMSAALRQLYSSLGFAMSDYNDDDSWELPLPGTFIVDRDRRIRHAFVDSDYTRRLEPAVLLDELSRIAAP